MAGPLDVHFLDVGAIQYGDSILCRRGDTTIYIDGAHPADYEGQTGYDSLPEQMRQILGIEPPFTVDLLVVTHCHGDHIGCLPKFVASGDLRCKWALIADPDLGWGEHRQDSISVDSLDPRVARLLNALREGSNTFTGPQGDTVAEADQQAFKNKYLEMLRTLEEAGATIVRYGVDSHADLAQEFSDFGLRILGPNLEHLIKCADAIAHFQRDASVAIERELASDAGLSDREILERVSELLADEAEFLSDRPGMGAALNDQSIVIAIEANGRKVLLPGDMQFAAAEVRDLDASIMELRRNIERAGPYDIIKTSHHSSYNGWDDTVLAQQFPSDGPVWLVHTGGLEDPDHPEPNVLRRIKGWHRANPRRLNWFRTDRNGLISIRIAEDGTITADAGRGRVNTFVPNPQTRREVAPSTPTPPARPVLEERKTALVPAKPSPVLEPAKSAADTVDIWARVPHTQTRVTITVDVQPAYAANIQTHPSPPSPAPPSAPPDPAPTPAPPIHLAQGRELPRLLFVTDKAALRQRIGSAAAEGVVRAIRDAQQSVLADQALSTMSAIDAAAAVRPYLREDIAGVVIVGGAEVVPMLRLDVLDPALRAEIASDFADDDDFIVWNDELYVDRDGDLMPEIPVSRIPDGGSAELVAAALSCSGPARTSRFGVRNVRRPFAEAVYNVLPGSRAALISAPSRTVDVLPNDVSSDFVYLMLHGDDGDSQRFWGDSPQGPLEAFALSRVPQRFSGVVFAGCCWGALTTTKRALFVCQNEPVVSKSWQDSIPLGFLRAGAQAFVGCTGVHYSPPAQSPQPTQAGGPMHVAFFNQLMAGNPPARALFNAKVDYLRGMPHAGADASPEEVAIEMKILRQFTCLGLGW
jgi:beta-lactamase superfamily II metal-dependent hydrolase